MHQMKHTTLFEPQLSWPDMGFRTAYETQGKSYDKMEFMQAQY